MLDKNYMKIYAMFMIHNMGFSSYKENGKFIINANNNKIIVTENECIWNGKMYADADALIKDYKF